MFASERRKAKVLNFSIAYGKTAHGLAQDFKTSLDEARETVKRWYADRPEVSIAANQHSDSGSWREYCPGSEKPWP